MESDLGVFKKLGVGRRLPNDPFFMPRNKHCHRNLREGIIDIDEVEHSQRSVQNIPCVIPICRSLFSSLAEFDDHYNSSHRFTCSQCKKNLPSPHLLDLHLSENHDSFFLAQAERKPMYKCYVETCNILSRTSEERRSHCIDCHKFPKDFRFNQPKKQGKTIKLEKFKGANNRMETESVQQKETKHSPKEKKSPKGVKKNAFLGSSAVKGKGRMFVPRSLQFSKPNNNVPSNQLTGDISKAQENSLDMSDLMDTLPSQ